MNWKKGLLFVEVLMALSGPGLLLAQEPSSDWGEVGFFVSVLPLRSGPNARVLGNLLRGGPVAGFQGEYSKSIAPWLALSGEGGMNGGCVTDSMFCAKTLSGGTTRLITTVMGGPRLTIPAGGKFRPWVHALFGVAVSGADTIEVSTGSQECYRYDPYHRRCKTSSKSTFSRAIGGGLDVPIRKVGFQYLTLRLGQTDYLWDKALPGGGSFRVSFGVVFRLDNLTTPGQQ